MMNGNVVALRREYSALVLIADGLLTISRFGMACNLDTMASMAAEARDAARKLAAMIERMMHGLSVPTTDDPGDAPAASNQREAIKFTPRYLLNALTSAFRRFAA